jgi:alkylated DNA repair dioxygenase AlkB
LQLRDRLTAITGYDFAIAIGNRYLDGNHSIGWHADQEKSMGVDPAIASISLGSVRRFSLKPKPRSGVSGQIEHFDLEHGSLLLMLPGCQTTHIHQLAKTQKQVGERINWTFRPHINSRKV